MPETDGAVDLAELPPPAAAPGETGKSAEVVPLRKGAVAKRDTAVLSIQTDQVWWNDRQLGALRNKYPEDEQPSDADLLTFLHLCIATGLDPFRNEIYYIGRKDDRAPGGRRFTAQTGIDGYRHIAERTGEFAGRLMTQWCGEDGEWVDVWLKPTPPAAARVAVARRGIEHPFYGVATYAEFVPLQEVWTGSRGNRSRVMNEDGTVKTKPMGLWAKMPSHMLAKCAEAQALRSAFPRQLAGLYVEEELHQADAEHMRARAEGERERQREAIGNRSWARNPVEGQPVDVIEGELVAPALPSREDLLEELANQANIMGRTLRQWVTRWQAARRKNLEDATDAELYELAASRRDMVSAKADEAGVVPFVALPASEQAGEAPEAGSGDESGPQDPEASAPPATPTGDGSEPARAEASAGVVDAEPGAITDAPAGQPASASELHDFEPGDGDEPQFCGFMGCQLVESDPVHRRASADGQESLL